MKENFTRVFLNLNQAFLLLDGKKTLLWNNFFLIEKPHNQISYLFSETSLFRAWTIFFFYEKNSLKRFQNIIKELFYYAIWLMTTHMNEFTVNNMPRFNLSSHIWLRHLFRIKELPILVVISINFWVWNISSFYISAYHYRYIHNQLNFFSIRQVINFKRYRYITCLQWK